MPAQTTSYRSHGHFLLAVLMLAALPVQAQLGALRRAAERRVEQKAEDRVQVANLIEPTFDQTTLEITAERLDRLGPALEKLKAGRAASRARIDALQLQSRALGDSARAVEDDRARNAYETASIRYSECRSGVRQAIESAMERQSEELAARMRRDPVGSQNDPKVKQMMAIVQEVAAAQQRGDTAAVRRAQERMMTAMGGGATDSVALDKAAMSKCGARPAKPASMVRSDRLRERADSLDGLARTENAAAFRVKGAELGMTDVQAAMFSERLRSWLAGMRQDAVITRTFSKPEYDLLVARRNDLRKMFYGAE
jgi:hypothetical protein